MSGNDPHEIVVGDSVYVKSGTSRRKRGIVQEAHVRNDEFLIRVIGARGDKALKAVKKDNVRLEEEEDKDPGLHLVCSDSARCSCFRDKRQNGHLRLYVMTGAFESFTGTVVGEYNSINYRMKLEGIRDPVIVNKDSCRLPSSAQSLDVSTGELVIDDYYDSEEIPEEVLDETGSMSSLITSLFGLDIP